MIDIDKIAENNWKNYNSIKEVIENSIKDGIKQALPQILKIVADTQKTKFSAGETGYLNKESLEILEQEILKELL